MPTQVQAGVCEGRISEEGTEAALGRQPLFCRTTLRLHICVMGRRSNQNDSERRCINWGVNV